MLTPLNLTLACGTARLPDELQVEIVRYAVTSGDIIPMAELREKTNDLLSPFAGFRRLREEAEDIVMRANTFSWEITAEDLSTDTTSIDELSLCTPWRPFVKDIEHLQIHLSILIEGGRFHNVNDLFQSGWDRNVVRRFRTLQDSFPKLKTLDVHVVNQCVERRPYVGVSAVLSELTYSGSGNTHLKGCPHFEWCKKKERMFQMQKLLMLVGAAWAPKLCKKTLMFVQSPDISSCAQPVVIGDAVFNARPSYSTAEVADSSPTPHQRARVNLLLREVNVDAESDIEEEQMGEGSLGRADRKMLSMVLTLPRVVFKMRCDI